MLNLKLSNKCSHAAKISSPSHILLANSSAAIAADCSAHVTSNSDGEQSISTLPVFLTTEQATKQHGGLPPSQFLQYFRTRLGDHKLKANSENLVHCPFPLHGKGHGDKNASLSINTGKGVWCCHAGCGGGGLVDFEMLFSDCGKEEAWKNVHEVLNNSDSLSKGELTAEGTSSSSSEPEAIYDYTDECGKLLFQVLRYPNKKFSQRRPNGEGGWIYNTFGVRRAFYRLPDVISAKYVAIVEGEKDVENLRAALGESHKDWAVTTSPGGANKWIADFGKFLTGKQVVVFPDNDDAGRKHANIVASSALEYAFSVKVVELPGLPDKGDVSDFLKSNTAAEILAIAAGTPQWTPPPSIQILKAAAANHPKITKLSDVTACEVEWLWEPYLAIGALGMVSGDPGAGKTYVAQRIAADLTIGRTPFKHTPRPAANVLYLSVENSPEHVLRPRFNLLGGDPSRFHLIEGSVRLSDISYLSLAVQQTQAELVVVDPIQSFLGADIDAHRANETRPLLDNLARLAAFHKCCILLLRHLSKEPKGRAIHRGLGSIDFTGAVRTEMLVGSSSTDAAQRALVHIKTNLGHTGPTLGFAINANGFEWTGESELTARDLLHAEAQPEKSEAMVEAKDFLLNALAKGPCPANDMFAEADQAGISKATLKRAKKALNISAKKDGQTGPWLWSLPEGDHTPEAQNP